MRCFVCEVCRCEGDDWMFRNGEKSKLSGVKLYRVYQGREARAQLCHLHALQLFTMGERRFLRSHLGFARIIADRGQNYEEDSFDYGFGAS